MPEAPKNLNFLGQTKKEVQKLKLGYMHFKAETLVLRQNKVFNFAF